jgi:hypothetical protein
MATAKSLTLVTRVAMTGPYLNDGNYSPPPPGRVYAVKSAAYANTEPLSRWK